MQQRYFIGITLPDELSNRISKAQDELFQPGKIMQPLIPHITLLPPNVLEKLPTKDFIPKAGKAAKKLLPAEIKLSETSRFERRVIYIKVESEAINHLYNELIQLLPAPVRAQLTAGRKFTPHITLAQAKPKQNLSPGLTKQLQNRTTPLLPECFTAINLSLFTWHGPRTYKVTRI